MAKNLPLPVLTFKVCFGRPSDARAKVAAAYTTKLLRKKDLEIIRYVLICLGFSI